MTFDEAVAATEARLGQRVAVQIKERGRVRRTCQGVLAPGLDGDTKTSSHHDDGSVVFKVAPYAWWFRLCPGIVTGVQEERDGRLLRLGMSGQGEFVIETLGL